MTTTVDPAAPTSFYPPGYPHPWDANAKRHQRGYWQALVFRVTHPSKRGGFDQAGCRHTYHRTRADAMHCARGEVARRNVPVPLAVVNQTPPRL